MIVTAIVPHKHKFCIKKTGFCEKSQAQEGGTKRWTIALYSCKMLNSEVSAMQGGDDMSAFTAAGCRIRQSFIRAGRRMRPVREQVFEDGRGALYSIAPMMRAHGLQKPLLVCDAFAAPWDVSLRQILEEGDIPYAAWDAQDRRATEDNAQALSKALADAGCDSFIALGRPEIIELAKLAGVHRIKIHALRHSHASLLISMGENPLIIKDRLGHEKIQTTLGTYGHLYPNSNFEVAKKLTGMLSYTPAAYSVADYTSNQFTAEYHREVK